MKTYTKEELAEILRKHKLWLANGNGGERADLSYANLHGANLRGANMHDADLRGANLSYADLRGANMHDADLRGANLSYADLCNAYLCDAYLCDAYLCDADLHGADLRGADLHGANLRGANMHNADLRGANLSYADLCNAYLCDAYLCDAYLCDADLHGANLRGADLRGANLRGAKNIVHPMACPEKGSFIGWKKCFGGLIVELEICADAKRSSATGRKCRCDKAKVISITTPEGTPVDSAISQYTKTFAYRVGETVSVDDFDDNRWTECAPGIHFFITRQEAVDY